MDEHRDFDGENLQETLSRASTDLRIPKEELHYEVLQEGRRGFLGVGSRGVLIRVFLPEEAMPSGSNRLGESQESEIGITSLSREGSAIQECLARFVPNSPFVIDFSVTEDEERISVELNGPDRGLFLERRGEALNALQVLLGRVAAQKGSKKPVFLDCDDFRRQRERELSEIASLVAEKVRRLGEPQNLAPMDPYERRLVHLALKDDPSVETHSDGEGFFKRVTISPRQR